jgi:hypothetical protein
MNKTGRNHSSDEAQEKALSAPVTNSPRTMESLKGLHQYYRDCLSQPVNFPDLGQCPPELIEWVTDRRNTDVSQLVEYLETLPGSGLSPDQDLALRLMLFTILQANLASDVNNRFPDYTLPPGIVANIKRSLSRVLTLHPAHPYIVICVQLLYRIKELDEVIVLSETYPEIFAKYAILQAITGFIHTMLGNYEKGLNYLQPLAEHPTDRNLPLVGLSVMTCQHFLGMVPEWPLAFDSLKTDTTDLPRLIAQLPPIEMIQPLASTQHPVVFVACDTAYFFQHALHLAYSIHESNAGKLDLHLHLYSPDQSVLAEIDLLRKRLPGLSIGVSAEYGAVPMDHLPSYYATARFVRAYQILGQYRSELCIMDADALFNGDWDKFIARLKPQTELVLACPETAPFWEHVLAGFVYCRPTPLAEHFLAKVSQFILRNMELKSVIWFTDQIALSACDNLFAGKDPAVEHIKAQLLIDIHFSPDALCWVVTTKKTGNPVYDAARERLNKRYT